MPLNFRRRDRAARRRRAALVLLALIAAALYVVAVAKSSTASTTQRGGHPRLITPAQHAPTQNSRSRSALPTTETLENAIAAPAIIGFSNPSAANGNAATL